METYPKFIIEYTESLGLVMIIAKCTWHRQLALNEKNVKGGGWWTLDKDNDTFTLSGDSSDFGRAKIEDIISCIEQGKVYDSHRLRRNFVDNGFKFLYKDIHGDVTELKR